MPDQTTYPLVQYFKDGGPVMWPLLLCSIAALAVILYKAWQFLMIRGGLDPLMSRVQGCLEAGNPQEAQEACEAFHGPVGVIVGTGLANAGQPKAVIREAVQDAGTHELATLESLLPVLQTVGNIAPLLGFLGTVLGMIDAFFAVARAGLGDPGTIAAGVAEALITTAAGLMIAVPTFAAYNYFVARVSSYTLQMERAASHVINLVAAEEGNSK